MTASTLPPVPLAGPDVPPRPVSLRKSYRHTGYYDIFGTSTARQRGQWADIRNAGRASGDSTLHAAYEVAREYDHVAWAYANGVRDTLMTILGYSHPLIETLLHLTWEFSAEYGWHVYVSEAREGGSRTSYVSAWEDALRARGIDLPRLSPVRIGGTTV